MTDSHSSPARSTPSHAQQPGPPRAPAENEATTDGSAGAGAAPRKRRLVGIDAARGLALIGMVSIHLLPAWDPETFEPTAQWTAFAGRSAALFALLAGVGLAFSTGGRTPHTGRAMTADRAGVAVRALLIASLGLAINQVIPGRTIDEVPAVGILVYYGMFFLLAIPFLRLSATALFAWAAVFAVTGPVLMQLLRDVLPAFQSYNPALSDLIAAPGATAAQLLLTGTYPALPYLTYILAGLALGRLDLGSPSVQAGLLVGGALLAAGAWLAYWVLILQAGGYEQLMIHTPALTEDMIDDVIVFGPDPLLPTSTWWWLAVAGPYTNTPLALLLGLGTGTAVLGAFLLLARGLETWLLPLSAMGAMTLTLYSSHLLVLSTEIHYDQPYLWFLVQIGVALVFAVLWRSVLGQGPLERLVAAVVRAVRRLVLAQGRTGAGLA